MMKFSALNIMRNALKPKWPKQWRNPEPRSAYDAIIIGGGGHGLGTA